MAVCPAFALGNRFSTLASSAHAATLLVAPATMGAATILSTSLRRTSMRLSLEDLFDRVDRSARAPVAGRDGNQSVQIRILRCARFESWRGPKVILGRINGIATRERGQHFRRAMTQAERVHVDQCAVVRPERDSQIELEHAVGAQQRPVTSTWQDPAAEPWAFEAAAGNGRDHACSVRYPAEPVRRGDDNLKRHQQT